MLIEHLCGHFRSSVPPLSPVTEATQVPLDTVLWQEGELTHIGPSGG